MALPSLHTRLPLEWSEDLPEPVPPTEKPRFGRYLEVLREHPDSRPLGPEEPDPVGLAALQHIPGSLRLRFLDKLYAAFRPTEPARLDRFIDAYLLLARQGFSILPIRSRSRRRLAQATTHALELMQILFRAHWHQNRIPPREWWARFLATFRGAGAAHLFAVRGPSLVGDTATTPLRPSARLLLQAATNPHAWESELHAHLEQFLQLLSEDVLLFPAASPSAYVESRRGRFVFDAAGDQPPVLPDGLDPRKPTAKAHAPDWWIIDASRALSRLTELRRNLDLGAAPARLHPLLAETPEAPRRILLQRLERILGRGNRRRRTPLPVPRPVHVAVGMEQAVRHCFAGRWSRSGDPATLKANVRLQSEVLAHPSATPEAGGWEAVEWDEAGIRLRGQGVGSGTLVGKPVLILDLEESPDTSTPRMQAGLVRWHQDLPASGGVQAGVELLPGHLHDGWCRISWSMGNALQEQPVLLLTQSQGPTSMLMPAGLFRSGAPFNIRIDNRDRLGEMIQLAEPGVHFEHVHVRLKDTP
ncbi:hypothetical protein [Thiohalorhabdus methylotrophus]|uniref:Uncharacterized protein n=1 Tax=Thiohalorhabdus methylotrophus TaxID=3242694 RepID=A0ABV4TW58_9GAMM